MSLFVGNISKNVRAVELEEEFDKFGPCTVNPKGSFAFVEFKQERDAEEALNELQNKELGGLKLAIEWSKKSGRFDPAQSNRPPPQFQTLVLFNDTFLVEEIVEQNVIIATREAILQETVEVEEDQEADRLVTIGEETIEVVMMDTIVGVEEGILPMIIIRAGVGEATVGIEVWKEEKGEAFHLKIIIERVMKIKTEIEIEKLVLQEHQGKNRHKDKTSTKDSNKEAKRTAEMTEMIAMLIWNDNSGISSEKLNGRVRGQDQNITKLKAEEEGLRFRLNQIDEQKQTLANNRQFRESQERFESQVQTLEGDKVSLMKRLNMVLSELEKATHEKSEINAKLLEQERIASELKKKLDEVSSLKNVVNRNLQDDLRYERDLNEKLKEELNKFEREKDTLLGKLKEQEDLSKDISRETSAINANLQKKSEELRRLEREHESNLNRLRELNGQLDGLRSQDSYSKNEKGRLEDELEDLTRERNELIRRMNDLSDKYEDYVGTMNRERIEIMRKNKNHLKLLTAKLFFQIFNESVQSRRKNALQEIKACSKHIQNMEVKMTRFARAMTNYCADRKRTYLRLWYRKAMNFVHENYKKLNLIEYNVNKKRKIKFYYKWKQVFLENRRSSDCKVDAVKMLSILLNKKENLKLRNYICKWKDFVDLRQYQKDFMFSLMSRKKQRIQRTNFVKWLAYSKKIELNNKYDKMTELVTDLWFKQRVFLGLRQAALESKTESSMIKFKAWKNWCETSRKNKYFTRKELLVDRIAGTRDERLVKQCFDAIRYGNINKRYEDVKDRLEKEIPIRQELERQRDTLIKLNKTKDKTVLFRNLCIRIADVKYRALMVWKENVQYYKHIMNRIKLRLIESHKRKLSKALFKWKETIDKKHMVELVSFAEDLMNENQELTNTLQNYQQEREKLQDCSSRQQISKLERIRNMLNRHFLRNRFNQWVANAEFVVSLESALFKTSKTIRRRKMRNGFNKYKKKVKEVKRLQYVKDKVAWFDSVRQNKSLDIVWDAWKSYVKRYKQGKKFLIRSIKGVDKLMTNEAFGKWKDLVYSARKQVYIDNIEELQKRKEDHEVQIKQLNRQIQVNDSTQKHLQSKMQSQSQKIIANFISRALYTQIARGFYTWKDTLQDHNDKKRFLKSTICYWIKNSQGKAFRNWMNFTLKSKELELANTLQTRENERRNLQRQKDQEEAQQANEVEELQQQLQEASQLKDQLKANYEKALETHITRIKTNTYVDKRRNIFCVWADYIKKEKNAINVIGAIARKNLRMEVFSRIRRTARENYLDQRAEKIMSNFTRMFKYGLINRYFTKWRGTSYMQLVGDMEKKQQELQDTKVKNAQQIQQMEDQKYKKAENMLKQKRQREIAMQWINQAVQWKQNQIKEDLLRQNIVFMKQRAAIKKWHSHSRLAKTLQRKEDRVVFKYNEKTIRACFEGWVNRTRISKLLCTRTVKFVKRMLFLDVAHGFSQLVHFKSSLDERMRERKEQGNKTIYNTLNRLFKHRMADALLNLRNRAFKKDFKEKFLFKVFKHSLLYRKKHYFGKWKHNNDRMALAEQINYEGDVVVERNEMKRNVKVLKDFLAKQGYNPQEIEKYLADKSEKQRGNMQKAIVNLFFKNSDFSIMPKAMNQWKSWVANRKMARQQAAFVVNALNHPLMWPFRKWKLEEANARAKLKDVSKTELINKIIADELAIGSAQSKIGRMDDAIDNLSIQRDSLLEHYVSGQKLALSLGKNNYLKTLYRAFIKWKRETKQQEQDRLGEQLDRTDQMINDLMQHINKLEGINNNLVGENEELRQAALDGIEIAKAVQELTKEREQLSYDLQDRGSTIKKLIEDNNNLSMRLTIAQREAEELEQLNDQRYSGQPERDSYY